MKRKLEELFTQLRVADIERSDETTLLHLESMNSEDTLAITVSIPNECVDNYDLGDYDQSKH